MFYMSLIDNDDDRAKFEILYKNYRKRMVGEIFKHEASLIEIVINNCKTESYKTCFGNKLICEHLLKGLHQSFDNYFRNPRPNEQEYVANCIKKINDLKNNITRLKNKLGI